MAHGARIGARGGERRSSTESLDRDRRSEKALAAARRFSPAPGKPPLNAIHQASGFSSLSLWLTPLEP